MTTKAISEQRVMEVLDFFEQVFQIEEKSRRYDMVSGLRFCAIEFDIKNFSKITHMIIHIFSDGVISFQIYSEDSDLHCVPITKSNHPFGLDKEAVNSVLKQRDKS